MEIEEKIKRSAELISNSNYTVALSGAGISTASGIPDFRSPGYGLWEKVDPMEVASIWSLKSNPRRVYEFMYSMAKTIYEAEPNPAHIALAQLEKKGLLRLVITQNIDNLHQRAGSKEVVEVHGNLREAICLNCHKIVPMEEFREKLEEKLKQKEGVPQCQCGGLLKPNVIFFGEQLPAEAVYKARRGAEDCEVMLVVGSSLVVQPVSMLPELASRRGAKIIVINLEATYIDGRAEVVIGGKVDEILPRIVSLL